MDADIGDVVNVLLLMMNNHNNKSQCSLLRPQEECMIRYKLLAELVQKRKQAKS